MVWLPNVGLACGVAGMLSHFEAVIHAEAPFLQGGTARNLTRDAVGTASPN